MIRPLLAVAVAAFPFIVVAQTPTQPASYVGSTTCKTCHPATYERWSKTRMANVVLGKRTRKPC